MRVTLEDLNTAAEWLEVNNGIEGEAESCERVAEYLRREINRRMKVAAIHQAARDLKMPVHIYRKLRNRR